MNPGALTRTAQNVIASCLKTTHTRSARNAETEGNGASGMDITNGKGTPEKQGRDNVGTGQQIQPILWPLLSSGLSSKRRMGISPMEERGNTGAVRFSGGSA